MSVAGDTMLAGRYRVGALLGQGGSACVYEGYDTRLARPVAIKRLRPEVAADLSMRRRFEQEARTAARLTHPNAVAVYDTGEGAGQAFLVMERLPGRSLANRIAEGPLAPAEATGVATDVLAALEAAHGLGLVHRDVKPGNILLTEEGRAKVADFGIAKSADLHPPTDTTLGDTTGLGLVLGTPAYLAPERLTGQPATARTDLYALGVVLFEALAGEKPEPGATSVPGVPPELAAVVVRALSPRPGDRFASASEMVAALHAATGAPSPVAAVAGAGPPTATGPVAGVPAPGGAGGRARREPNAVAPAGRPLGRWLRRAGRRRSLVLGSLVAMAAPATLAVVLTGSPASSRLANTSTTGPGRPAAAHGPDASGGTPTSTTTPPTTSPPAVQTVSSQAQPAATVGTGVAGAATPHPPPGAAGGRHGPGGRNGTPGHGGDGGPGRGGDGGPGHGGH